MLATLGRAYVLHSRRVNLGLLNCTGFVRRIPIIVLGILEMDEQLGCFAVI